MSLLTIAHVNVFAQDVGLIINEFSNGSSGTREYVELLVVGCPGRGEYPGNIPDVIGPDPSTIDIRGWIIDDNNGDFSDGADLGRGIATGHLRFADDDNWANVPVGSVILIYNPEAFATPGIFNDDPEDTNNNLVYILAVDARDVDGNALLEVNADRPNNANPSYIGSTYLPTQVDSWETIGLSNSGDAIQTREPAPSAAVEPPFFHGISYGNISGRPLINNPVGTQSVHFGGVDGGGRVFFLNHPPNPTPPGLINNYRLAAAYDVQDITNPDPLIMPQTAGRPNNNENALYFSNFRQSTDAGLDQSICIINADFTINLSALGRIAEWRTDSMWVFQNRGEWTLESGPSPTANFNPVDQATSTVSVSASGVYRFRWTNASSSPTGCVDSDVITVNFFEPGLPANAGPDQNICGNGSININLDADPGVFGGRWTFIPNFPGQPAPTILNPTDANTQVTLPQPDFYRFRWTIVPVSLEGSACEVSDEVRIGFVPDNVVAEAGANQTICDALNTNFGAQNQPGVWEVVSTPATVLPTDIVIDSLIDPQSTFTVPAVGQYTFRWRVGANATGGCEDSDEVVFNFIEAPLASAAPPVDTICGFSIELDANAPQAGALGAWTVLFGPGNATISPDVNEPNINVQVDTEGRYQFRWQVREPGIPGCANEVQFPVVFLEEPVANAGSDVSICGFTTNFSGSAINTIQTVGLWTQIDGPSTASITDNTLPGSAVSVGQAGTYTFVWELNRTTGQIICLSRDTVQLTFFEAPVVNAGSDVTLCGLNTVLGANPAPTGVSGQWSLVSGPGQATFEDANNPNSIVNVDTEGTYTLRWTLTRLDLNTCQVADEVAITLLANPMANAGQDTVVCELSTNFSANVPSTPLTQGQWTQLAGPTMATIQDINSAQSLVSVSQEGVYTFIWVVSQQRNTLTCTNQDTVEIAFFNLPNPEAGPDTLFLCGLQQTLVGNLPPNTVGAWRFITGPRTVVPVPVNDSSASINVPTFGIYTFAWRLNRELNGSLVCGLEDTIRIEIIPLPMVDAGEDRQVCFPISNTTQLSAMPSPGLTGTGVWSGGNGATIDDPDDPNTSISVPDIGTYSFIWTIEPGTTCEQQDTVNITFVNVFQTEVEALTDSTCGFATSLRATASSGAGMWSAEPSEGVVFSDPNNPETDVTVPDAGFYTFTWTTAPSPCQASASTQSVFVPSFDLGSIPQNVEVVVEAGNTVQVDVDLNIPGVTYQWLPTDGVSDPTIPNPFITPIDNTIYTVFISSGTDGLACNLSIQVSVEVDGDDPIPNVFSPDGDNINETWEIPLLSRFPGVLVKVYNRWGQLVFESDGYEEPWDGNFNNKTVATTTFYYVIDLRNGQTPFTGTVTVLR